MKLPTYKEVPGARVKAIRRSVERIQDNVFGEGGSLVSLADSLDALWVEINELVEVDGYEEV